MSEDPDKPKVGATGTPRDRDDEGLTQAERDMLASLAGGASAAKKPAEDDKPPAQQAPSAPKALSPEEEDILALLAGEKKPPRPVGGAESEPKTTVAKDDARAAEEEAMLAEFRKEGMDRVAPKRDAEAAKAEPEPPAAGESGLSAEEEAMLSMLGGDEPPKAKATAQARPVPLMMPKPPDAPLSESEEQILKQVADESQRVSDEELPAMFDSGKPETETEVTPAATGIAEALAAGAKASAAQAEDVVVASVVEPGASGLEKALALPLDLINRPFEWVSPVVRMGLGLAGIMLIITLLMVILARMVFG